MVPRMRKGTRREDRKKEAAGRQAEAAARTPEQQLARLDLAFGPGRGAAKERAKLARKIDEAKPAKPVKPAETPAKAPKRASTRTARPAP